MFWRCGCSVCVVSWFDGVVKCWECGGVLVECRWCFGRVLDVLRWFNGGVVLMCCCVLELCFAGLLGFMVLCCVGVGCVLDVVFVVFWFCGGAAPAASKSVVRGFSVSMDVRA